MGTAQNIVVGGNGKAYLADIDAVMPTDSTSGLSGDWTEVGYVNEAGVKITFERPTQDIDAWNSPDGLPVLIIPTARPTTVAMAMREWSAANLVASLGGGSITAGGGVAEVQTVILTGFSGVDSFHLTYAAQESAVITRGGNYTAAGIEAAYAAISGVTDTVTVSDVSDAGFLVTWNTAGAKTALSVTTPSGVTGVVTTLVDGVDPGISAVTYTLPALEDGLAEKALVVQYERGANHHRWLFPRFVPTDNVELDITRINATDLPLMCRVLAPDAGAAVSYFTDQPSMLA